MSKTKSLSDSAQCKAIPPKLQPEKKQKHPSKDYERLSADSNKPSNSKPQRSKFQKVADMNGVIEDPLAELNDLCWNPLDGPVSCKKSPEKEKSEQSSTSKKSATPESSSNKSNDASTSKNSKAENVAAKEANKKLLAAKMPWFDNLFDSENNFLPLLGIFPLEDLGFWSDDEVKKILRKKVEAGFIFDAQVLLHEFCLCI